jgi:hypothetical protein
VTDSRRADAVLRRKSDAPPILSTGRIHHGANVVNGGLGEDGSAVSFADAAAPLRDLVENVVGRRAEKEMIRPHTAGVVAPVQNPQAMRDRADEMLERSAMRLERAAEVLQVAVPTIGSVSSPEPATRCFLGVLVKFFRNRKASCRHVGLDNEWRHGNVTASTRRRLMRFLALLFLLPALAFAASYTPDVEIRVPEGTSVKVTKRATNTSKDVLVTVNKDSRYTIVFAKPTTPPVVTPPVVTPPAGTSDFDARKSAPGVVRYWDFDTPASVNIGCAQPAKTVAECANFKVDAGNITTPTIDAAVKASGAGSLRFDVGSGPGSSNAAGAFNGNFSSDLKTQFGENSEFFVQWRQRFNQAMVDTQITTNDGSPQGGIKMMGVEAGDVADPAAPYGFRQHAACEAIGVLVQTYYQTRTPISYNSCTGSASHGPYAGLYTNEPGGDYGLQNAAGCLYSKPTAPQCFRWVADEWLTFELRIKTGPRVNGEFQNSEVQLWGAREGKAPVLLINWRPGVGGYFPLTANDGNTGEQQNFGKVWLLPYMTARNETITSPLMQTWYDELIISRQAIKFPGGFALDVPTTPVVTPPIVVPPVVTPPMTWLPAWRAGKTVGTWFEIANTTGMLGIVHPAEWNPIDGWNGLGAGGTQWVCAACGGHGDWQNQVHVVDLNVDQPRWTTVDPGSPQSAVTVGAYYADGKPTSRHTYQSTQVVGNRVFLFGVYATFATGIDRSWRIHGRAERRRLRSDGAQVGCRWHVGDSAVLRVDCRRLPRSARRFRLLRRRLHDRALECRQVERATARPTGPARNRHGRMAVDGLRGRHEARARDLDRRRSTVLRGRRRAPAVRRHQDERARAHQRHGRPESDHHGQRHGV